jgi:type I restriction enzyme S subunit
MELKPGYKQTGAGVIPEDWSDDPLGRHVRITSGESPSGIRFSGSGIPYFKVEQLSSSEKYLSIFSTPYHFEKGKTVPRGSVIFAKRGAAIALNKVRILAHESFMDTNLMALTPDDELDGEFLYYALGYIGLWQFADTTSVPQINNKHIKPLIFPLPPTIDEQRAIATALSDVDALLDGLDRLIAKKRDLKQAAMQQLLTGKTRLPGFEGEWEETSIGKLAALRNGYTFKSSTYTNNGLFRVITIANVQDGRMDLTECNTINDLPNDLQPHHQLHIGDLLISMTGNVGRVCRVTHSLCLLNQRVGLLCPITVSGEFLFHVLSQRSFLTSMFGKAKGGAQGNLSKSDISDYTLLVPTDPKEQTAIAAVLSDMDAEIAALEQRRNKTKDIKQAMMQELLTGKTRLVTPGGSNA